MPSDSLPDHFTRLTNACVLGGFEDDHEAEVVSLWAHGEIGRLRAENEALRTQNRELLAADLLSVKEIAALKRMRDEILECDAYDGAAMYRIAVRSLASDEQEAPR